MEECKVTKEQLEIPDFKVTPACKEIREHKALPERRVFQEHQELLGCRAVPQILHHKPAFKERRAIHLL
jgi:hypothetical protein